MTGYYLMHRGWLDHPALGGVREPFCRRAAWAWLIENAKWQDTEVTIGIKRVMLRRGQLSHSLRFLAKAWGWDDPKVRRFIARLVEEKMIDCVTDAGQTVITICNYEAYQVPGRVTDAPADAGPTQDRRTTDANKNEGNTGNEDPSPFAEASGEGVRATAQPALIDFPGATKKPGRESHGTRLPADWSLPDDWRAYAIEAGLDPPIIDREAENFRDYWHAKPGQKGRMADWKATWRRWVRTTLERSNGRVGQTGRRGGSGWYELGQRIAEGGAR